MPGWRRIVVLTPVNPFGRRAGSAAADTFAPSAVAKLEAVTWMQDRKQAVKSAWILSAMMAGSALGLLLIEAFLGNPSREITRWGAVVAFAGLSLLSAGMAFRQMAERRDSGPDGFLTAPYGGRLDYQLMGFGAAIALIGLVMHVIDRIAGA
jgi:hypothetical protein